MLSHNTGIKNLFKLLADTRHFTFNIAKIPQLTSSKLDINVNLAPFNTNYLKFYF